MKTQLIDKILQAKRAAGKCYGKCCLVMNH